MERIRYVGVDKERDIALPGGCIRVERMKWFDLEAAAVAAGIAPGHAEIVARGLTGPDWETEEPKAPKPTAATRAADKENDQ